MTYVATPVINIPSIQPFTEYTDWAIHTPTYRDINTPTQLISNVMNMQVHTHTHAHTHTHTHTQYPYNTGVSLNSGRATPQNVFDVVEICLKCFDVK